MKTFALLGLLCCAATTLDLSAASDRAALESPAVIAQFPYLIPEALARKTFSSGNRTIILAVRGDRPAIEAGGTYYIEGRYAFGSAPSATVALHWIGSATTSTSGNASQVLVLKDGLGLFARTTTVSRLGRLHLAIYPEGQGHAVGILSSDFSTPRSESPVVDPTYGPSPGNG